MSAYEYLLEQSKKRIEEQLQNSVVVWVGNEITTILNRSSDKREINKIIELMNRNDNIRIEVY